MILKKWLFSFNSPGKDNLQCRQHSRLQDSRRQLLSVAGGSRNGLQTCRWRNCHSGGKSQNCCLHLSSWLCPDGNERNRSYSIIARADGLFQVGFQPHIHLCSLLCVIISIASIISCELRLLLRFGFTLLSILSIVDNLSKAYQMPFVDRPFIFVIIT